MHLRTLEMHGFKAFAERQRFEFGPGITVVVGPNGSGKSNVADAIRWALGEQSPKQIRARRTEDIIFSGSEKRRALSAAEVTLTLDNADAWMPIEYGEVAVTRRADRSGENSYRINDQRVRLGDVQDLFRRAQVGQNSYAMMSQGLVDEVLAMRPRERRSLIEEAGELGRHRHQVVLSERRLSETRDNLGRVRMLLREIEPRVRQLDRQSRRAQRYSELAEELAGALSLYFETELRIAQEALTAARAEHDQRSEAFAAIVLELDGVEERSGALETEVAVRRGELGNAQDQERSLAEEALSLEQQTALVEQRQELLGERVTEIARDVEALSISIPDDEEFIANEQAVETDASMLSGRHAAASEVVEREREALGDADEATRLLLRELAEAEARRARHEVEREELHRQTARDAELAERAVVERELAGQRRTELLARMGEHGVLVSALHERAIAQEQTLSETRRRRDAAERALEEEQRQLVQVGADMRTAEALVIQLEERRLLVQRFSEQVPTAGLGTQALLDAARAGVPEEGEAPIALIGVVGRLIHVPEGLENAIEAALAERIGAIVVERSDEAFAALEFLRERRAGLATIYALEQVPSVSPLNLFNERGVIGVAARLVRTAQRHRGLVDALLGRTIVVENLETARRMLPRGLGSVVTRDGILLRANGSVFGGRSGEMPDQFALPRELAELPEQQRLAREKVLQAKESLSRQEDTVADSRERVVLCRRAVDDAETERRVVDTDREALRQKFAPLSAKLRQLRAVLSEPIVTVNDEDRASLVVGVEGQLVTVGTVLATLRDRSQALVAERESAVERLAAAQANLATIEGERRVAEAQREERAASRARDRELLTERQDQLGRLERDREDLALQLTGLRQQLVNARSKRGEAQQRVGPAHAALADLEEEARKIVARRTDGHARQLSAERELLEAEAQLRRYAEAAQQLLVQIADEGLQVLDDGRVLPLAPVEVAEGLRSEFDDVPPVLDPSDPEDEASAVSAPTGAAPPFRGGADVDTETLRDHVSGLRTQIRNLGPVNVEALSELKEERQRVEFLSAQVGDLEAAENELRGAITDLRRLIRRQFGETFEQVNVAFGEYFHRFFGGGHAELRLEKTASEKAGDEVDLPDSEHGDDETASALMEESEPGVEITAQPPGKRIASLAMLSGGERSMASVALLFALLSVNPAPVCVLDEVDAALDEANVSRFVETLRELTARSQFIVISHNRNTIEAADAIYGVSMGDDSVSRVLSLRLDEIESTASA